MRNNTISLNGFTFEILLSKEDIQSKISELTKILNSDLKDKPLLILGVLKGSFIFMADLIRGLEMPCEIQFIRAVSYGTNMQSSGKVGLSLEDFPIEGKDILIVEDIIDSGHTLKTLTDRLRFKNAASIITVTLLSKPDARQVNIEADYVCFDIPNKFVVGYGLDYNEDGRQYPDIYVLKD